MFNHVLDAGMIILSALVKHKDSDVIKAVKGVVLSGPVIRINPKLVPPAPVLTILRSICTLFPKYDAPFPRVFAMIWLDVVSTGVVRL
jgi:hypothetical protein